MAELPVGIVGFERYSVTSDGRVFSTIRAGRELKPFLNGNGYLAVSLMATGATRPQKFHIHRLVAEHFIPNPNNHRTINHKDGNKQNNQDANLEWASYSDNNKHALDTGLKQDFGETNYKASLTNNQVREIRELLKHHTQKHVARVFGVDRRTVGKILRGETWGRIA